MAGAGRRACQALRSRNRRVGRARGVRAAAPAPAAVASRPQIRTERAWPESSVRMVATMVMAVPP